MLFCWEAVALFPQGHRDVDSWDELVRIDIDAVEVSTMGGGHFRLMAGQLPRHQLGASSGLRATGRNKTGCVGDGLLSVMDGSA